MEKYIGSFMAERILNNKHYSDYSLITRDKFKSMGEIVISNEYGFEGIYILNTNGDVVKIGNRSGQSGSGSTESGSTEYIDAEFLRNYLRAQAYMTSAQTAGVVSALETALSLLDGRVTALENGTPYIPPTSGGGEYDPAVINALNGRIDALSSATEEHIGQSITDFQELNDRIDALSGLTAQILTREEIEDIVTEKIAFLVSSADSMFNVLREIAEWVESDTTGSAALINDVGQLKSDVSGLTGRLMIVEDDINSLEDDMVDVNTAINQNADILESAVTAFATYIEDNDAEIEAINEKIDSIEIPSDDHIRDIAAQEVSSLVSSADSMYQVLQELADWVENDTTGSAALINDVADLKDRVADAETDIDNLKDAVTAMSGQTPEIDETKILEVSANSVANSEKIDELSAETISLRGIVENLPSGSSIDEATFNALKEYIDAQIASLARNGDHLFLSRGQYNELIANGVVVISGETYYYSDSIYYCIYEGGQESGSTSGSSYEYDEETGMIEISGNTEVVDGIVELAAAEIDNDGYVTITEVEPVVEPEVDEDGFVEIPSDQVDEDGYVEIPDGWEII